MSINATKIAAFCAEVQEHPLCSKNGAFNIVYVEGMNEDGTLNDDVPNLWNDRRLILMFAGIDGWQIVHNSTATTEPGKYYTEHPKLNIGCARIAFGYHPPAWKRGFHKGIQPALVQVKKVRIHRDLNRDGRRNRNEPAFWSDPIGLNDHTTSRNFNGNEIGKFSAGCLVGKIYHEHMEFLRITHKDSRIIPGQTYLYDKWVVPGDVFNDFRF